MKGQIYCGNFEIAQSNIPDPDPNIVACHRSFGFSPKLDANMIFIISYSLDFDDGLILTVNNSPNGEVQLFPNPGNKVLTLAVATDGAYEVKILTLTGKIMQTHRSDDPKLILNTTNLPKGMYLIQVSSEDGLVNSTLRWVKSEL